MEDIPVFHATRIDKTHVAYTCPYPKTVCPMREHIHGSNNDLSNRTISRVCHCNRKEIKIVIDENTKRLK